MANTIRVNADVINAPGSLNNVFDPASDRKNYLIANFRDHLESAILKARWT
jgi:hypothetical protein